MILTDAAELEKSLNEKLDARFSTGRNLLKIARPSGNEVEISASVSDLESAIKELAKREAEKHGVTVEELRLNFHGLDQRSLELTADVRAKKMFFTTTVRISGRLTIDEKLAATVSNLSCTGEGAIGSMASGFLQPQLAKIDGRTFPLATMDLDGQTLRDVRVRADNRLTITAELSA